MKSKILDDLVLAGNLLFELFRYDALKQGKKEAEAVKEALELANKWLTTPQSFCFNKIPRDLILMNEGQGIIDFLKAKQGL